MNSPARTGVPAPVESVAASQEARSALDAGRVLIEHRYPHAGPLAELEWTWRVNISFYDALYVARAVRLGVPLITADSRLSSAPDLACQVEVV
ncbi:MAG: type II toxin-antitoxin system VapC family toxin [Nakamurella sp.]